jgi:hypothetical protein
VPCRFACVIAWWLQASQLPDCPADELPHC